MVMKPTNAYKHLRVYYIILYYIILYYIILYYIILYYIILYYIILYYIILYFGHSYGLPQGVALQRIYYNTFSTNAQMKDTKF